MSFLQTPVLQRLNVGILFNSLDGEDGDGTFVRLLIELSQERRTGRLNPDVPLPVRLEDVTPENFMRILQINLLSCVLAAKHASTAMQVTSPAKPTSRGSIVMTASVAGLGGLGNASGPAYGASKAGVINLTRALSWQLGRFNISINSINPGLIETSLNADAFAKSAKRGTLPGAAFTNAFGRHGIPEEVANVVVFLASDDSSYVTGQVCRRA